MKNPKVSVVIPTYNHEKYVGEAIQSVLDQTFQDFEITIEEAIIKVEYLLRKHKSFKKALTLMAKNLIRERKRKYRISVDPFGDCMFG